MLPISFTPRFASTIKLVYGSAVQQQLQQAGGEELLEQQNCVADMPWDWQSSVFNKPVGYTQGAGPCLIVGVVENESNPQTRKVSLFHLVPFTNFFWERNTKVVKRNEAHFKQFITSLLNKTHDVRVLLIGSDEQKISRLQKDLF